MGVNLARLHVIVILLNWLVLMVMFGPHIRNKFVHATCDNVLNYDCLAFRTLLFSVMKHCCFVTFTSITELSRI